MKQLPKKDSMIMFLVPADGGMGHSHADVHMTYAWLKLHGQEKLAEKFLHKYKVALKHQRKENKVKQTWVGTISYKYDPAVQATKTLWQRLLKR